MQRVQVSRYIFAQAYMLLLQFITTIHYFPSFPLLPFLCYLQHAAPPPILTCPLFLSTNLSLSSPLFFPRLFRIITHSSRHALFFSQPILPPSYFFLSMGRELATHAAALLVLYRIKKFINLLRERLLQAYLHQARKSL